MPVLPLAPFYELDGTRSSWLHTTPEKRDAIQQVIRVSSLKTACDGIAQSIRI